MEPKLNSDERREHRHRVTNIFHYYCCMRQVGYFISSCYNGVFLNDLIYNVVANRTIGTPYQLPFE